MPALRVLLFIAFLASSAFITAMPHARTVDDDAAPPHFRVLVFSKTAGFRHDSIPDGIAALRRLGEQHHVHVDATEDSSRFTDEQLANYDVVVFLSTTGDILNQEQQRAFERFIRSGRGYVGIHAAADTEYDWPWYGQLVGAYFKSHPAIQPAEILVAERGHPSTTHLPLRWRRTDEWYDYRDNPRGNVHVLMTLNESSYTGGVMGHDHPIAWCHEFDGGRAWYTGGGHTRESFTEPLFLEHILGGLRWAAGVEPTESGATINGRFEKIILDDRTTDPMELAIARDGRVFFVERGGSIKVWHPATQSTHMVGFIDVTTALEDGLLGIALDPRFDETGWLYVFYSPLGAEPVQHLSRFTVYDNRLVEHSESVLLKIPVQREQCCHSGGSLAFGPDGTLYLSTGDNTNPFASDGFAPIDERPGRSAWDAQKSSANPHDLRGKILRILPLSDGTYAIPDGNLFTDAKEGAPEIYAMGLRNPFRIAVDSKTGWLYWGDVGPDASSAREGRGPAGQDEFNQARGPGFFGWPYFVGDNKPYHAYDFANNASGAAFDPAHPVNNSPNNTGARALPPAQPAWIWYPYGTSAEFPALGAGGRCAMAGPVYHVDQLTNPSPHRLPDYFDGTLFLYEWARDAIYEVKLDEDGNPLVINPFMPTERFVRPHDLELGPDGCLYLIEWGTGFGGGNRDAVISRIEYYASGLRPPRAVAAALPDSGGVPLTVQFASAGSVSRNNPNDPLTYAWDFDGDGVVDSTEPNPIHTFTERGNRSVRLTVTDAAGVSAVRHVPLSIGNTAPEVRFTWPLNGSIADFGDTIQYAIHVHDAEDNGIDPARVTVQPALGHDTHAHPLNQHAGLSGAIELTRDEGHGADADLFNLLTATYTDRGAPGLAPLTSTDTVLLQPRRKQAAYYTRAEGVIEEKSADPLGGISTIALDRRRDYAVYEPVNLVNIDAISLRLGAEARGGSIELRRDALDGPLIAAFTIAPEESQRFAAGLHRIRLEYFENTGGAGMILRFSGGGRMKQIVPGSMLFRADTTTPGLDVAYYELSGPQRLPDFSALTPFKRDVVEEINFPSTDGPFAGSGRADEIGAVFEGWIHLPEEGVYTFFIESDDGSRLFINDALVADNDGLHGMVEAAHTARWMTITMPIEPHIGTHALYLRHGGPNLGVLRVNWIEFHGEGARAAPPRP